MKKLTMIAAAAAAAGAVLFTYPQGLAQPSPPEQAEVDRAAVDRAVERHLGSLLQKRLHDLQEERAWAMGMR